MSVSRTKGPGGVKEPVTTTTTTTPAGQRPAAVVADGPLTLPSERGIARFLGALSPKTNAVKLLAPDQVEAKIDALAKAGVKVETIGHSREGRPLYALSVGKGPKNVVAMAGAHPDEPVGTVTCLHLAQRLATDPRLAALCEQATFHFVPMANPDGSAANASWLPSWGPRPDLGAYLSQVRRDVPKDDVEFGFPSDPSQAVRPENAAIAGWFDRIGKIDHYVSLHSMFIGGGALFLLMGDLEGEIGKVRFVQDRIAAKGLPLHDKDRFGQKGFHRLGPGLMTAPTKDEMAAFFAAGGASAQAAQFKLNSMQYVTQRNDCPLAFVSEIPLCYDKRISSMTPIDRSRVDEELRFASALEGVYAEAAGWSAALAEAGVPAAEVEAFEASMNTGRAATNAMRGDLARYGDAPATEGNVLENDLNILRRRAALAARGLTLLESAPRPNAARATLQGVVDDTIRSIRSDFALRHPSLEAQVDLQTACVLAGLVPRESTHA